MIPPPRKGLRYRSAASSRAAEHRARRLARGHPAGHAVSSHSPLLTPIPRCSGPRANPALTWLGAGKAWLVHPCRSCGCSGRTQLGPAPNLPYRHVPHQIPATGERGRGAEHATRRVGTASHRPSRARPTLHAARHDGVEAEGMRGLQERHLVGHDLHLGARGVGPERTRSAPPSRGRGGRRRHRRTFVDGCCTISCSASMYLRASRYLAGFSRWLATARAICGAAHTRACVGGAARGRGQASRAWRSDTPPSPTVPPHVRC